MRRLADYAFMLRDYRFAFSTYDSVRRDFQNNEKYVKFLAGTQEMLGLCTLLTDGLGRSLETYLEHSVTAYTEAKTPHYAARVAILYYEMLRHKNQLRDAPALLIRMTGEDSDLRSALFLEQAALCFLRMRPPMVRKYAFHLILAGHRFGKCGQREHAYRCYATALDVYDNLGWSLVEDHVHFTLGRQSFHLSHLDGAVDHFLKLLRKSRQPAPQQTAYLREFLYIYKQYATRATPDQISHFPALPVPEINDSTVRVSLLEHHSGQPTHVSAVDDEWETMERDLFEEGYTRTPSLGRKFYAGYKAPMSGGKDAGKTTCAVGEPVFVSFEMHNPMQVPIQAHNLFLECAFGTNPPARANLMYNPDVSPPERVEYAEFDAEVVGEVALEPGDTAVIQLRVFPKREGELIVHGVRYILCGSVPTHHPFQKRGRRQTDAVSIKSDTAVYAVDNSLKLVVTSPMPVLDVIFHAFPDTLLSGEVVRAVLEVNNKGNRGLRNLKLKTSHPSFFCVGDGGDMNDDSYAPRSSTQTPTSFESLTSPNHVNETSTVTIKLPTSDTRTNENGMLESGTTTLVPVWIRGDKIGKHVFRFLFGYQSEDKTDKVSYRTLRYSMTTTVQPSLRINAFTRPSARALDEFVLGIEIENLQKSSDVVLKQISSLSPSWIVQSIEEPALDDKTSHLPGGQTLFVYFRFGRAKVSVDPKNTPEALTTRAIERLILGEDEVGLRNEKIALNVSSLASAGNLVTCSSPAFQGLTTTSRLQWRLAQLSMQHSGLTPAQLSSLFTLYLTDDVDLALFWESPGPNGTVHRGHHYIIGINLGLQAPLQMQRLAQLAASKGGGAGRALYAETVREKKAVVASLLKVRQKDASPVRVVVKAAHEARGSFADGPCTFPITLVLRNTSRVSTARYMLETLHPGRAETDSQPPSTPGPPNAVSSSSSSPDFVWLGKTYASGVLPPQSETTVTLLACFARPGVYDVNRWRASVGLGGGEDGAGAGTYVQGPGLPHWVTVLNG
ncbi:Trafficking protein particle complex 8 [Borealophlyctis nickersoniae]|nr:Trafficking protein particle complex 8 [Borealophlyctis nickersoniae]